MDYQEIERIAAEIKRTIGASMRGSESLMEARRGLAFWFDNYNRSSGPIFSIRPGGLKRHVVTVKFGSYAEECVEHINNFASDEDYTLAHALVEQLKTNYEVRINNNFKTSDWLVSASLEISVIRKVLNPHASGEIRDSIRWMMVPLIAAIAELIGYEDLEKEAEIEGDTYLSISQKRERSPRNRLLCIAIHGEKCGVCGFISENYYGESVSSIIEVHHIEPVSALSHPRAYDPKTDLIPLCPNCHRAAHKRKPPFLPEELRSIMGI
ncbi:HNH endonuclease [Idiomarina abyssalis]|uniref:HNH endonuclease n=1 Tax=Idiomarina abyssalis TaxID=86102 RepID=UPI0006C831B7|nr:HNH endonuclease [Idiomarina abyssalis]SFT84157.1 5-methylcytosine-specific restriction enzyme A [Idiomarina abyssalis]